MTKKRACACLALALALIVAPFPAAWVGADAEETEEPTASIEATTSPSTSPEATATATATETATATPSASLTAEPTGEPTPTPEPTATGYPTLQLGSAGDEVTNLQSRLIQLKYLDAALEGMPTGVFDEDTEAAVKLFQRQNGLEETGIADDSLQQLLYDERALAYSSGKNPGGFSGGGGRSRGSIGGGSGAQAEEEPGGITPGEALTSSHAPGDMDMSRYWSVELTVPDGSGRTLELGGEALDISLADGMFVCAIEGGALTLTAEAGSTWNVNCYALKILSISGIERLRLCSGSEGIAIPTDGYLSGAAYDALRAKGCVSKDFVITLALSGGAAATVEAAGGTYPVDGATMILNVFHD